MALGFGLFLAGQLSDYSCSRLSNHLVEQVLRSNNVNTLATAHAIRILCQSGDAFSVRIGDPKFMEIEYLIPAVPQGYPRFPQCFALISAGANSS